MTTTGRNEEQRQVWPPVSLHGGHTVAGDGATEVAAMAAAAEQVGMEVYGLSEHFYRPADRRYLYDDESLDDQYGRAGWPRFAADVQEQAARSGERGGPRLLLGAEVEYLPGREQWTLDQLGRFPLDYTVLSVHFLEVDGEVLPFDVSPRAWAEAAARCGGEAGLFKVYYEHLLAALEWEVGDVLGHLDVIKIHASGGVDDAEVDRLVDRVLERCAGRGMRLDLNARGLSKPCAEVYPSPAILARAHAAGVEIITGDDSHHPAGVGLDLERAAKVAHEVGYREVRLPERLGGRGWPLLRPSSAVGTSR